MSRFLTYLGVNITTNIPKDVLDGGKLIDGLQMIYEDMPQGAKKDSFANAIAETASILMRRINNLKGITNPKVEEELEQIEEQAKSQERKSYSKEVKQMESIPNPIDDTSLDDVDPPIDKESGTNGDVETTSNELDELINEIHKLQF